MICHHVARIHGITESCPKNARISGFLLDCGWLNPGRRPYFTFASRSSLVLRLRCRFGNYGSLAGVYTIAQRPQIRCARLQLQEAERLRDSGECNPPEQSKYGLTFLCSARPHGCHCRTARRDHEAPEELSSRAQDYSMAAPVKTLELAKQLHVPMRA